MSKFREWYLDYDTQITWFILGVTFDVFLTCISQGEWIGAGIEALVFFLLASMEYYKVKPQ